MNEVNEPKAQLEAVPLDCRVSRQTAWEAVKHGRTWRVMLDLGDGRARCVMRPGVGEFKSRHPRVYMTYKGAQKVADDLNTRKVGLTDNLEMMA